ncbi:hypothetical protein [Sphingomonas sp. LR55]|uniref:hypothetical protein n=1 Tax=Sphingomonas sp. LR55 TaxID=3050231 RepID=UPI002FE369FF
MSVWRSAAGIGIGVPHNTVPARSVMTNRVPAEDCWANTPWARATRRVGGIVTERVHRDPQRGHVADQLDRDRPRAFVRGHAQARPCLGIG